MNIILKAFDGPYCKQILETAFRDFQLGTCISIVNDQNEWPDLQCREHLWINASDQRAGRYPDIDWNEITPIDEERIEAMRHCEAYFFTMLERYARYGDIPYVERKRQYLAHLQFWNYILETKHIDLLLMNTEPHQCYDWVLYCLCKLKGIPTLYIERCYIVDGFYLVKSVEESAAEIGDRLKELQLEYADESKNIPLSPKFEEYFRSYTGESADPWYMYRRPKRLARRSLFAKWSGTALRTLTKKPLYLLRSIASPSVWSRKVAQHRTALMYDQFTETPDLSKPYIYLPLHFQPEGTTCPMGGAYTDQELIAELLAAHLPPHVRIYVKEHPAQEELYRSEAFYQSLRDIPSVTLVPRDFSTFELTDHALAAATVTGTAGFEALFRGVPVLMFGHRFFQYAPGVHRITTVEDLRRALANIIERGERPTLRDARLLLKAVEDTATPYVGSPPSPHEHRSREEKAVLMGEKIAERLRAYLANETSIHHHRQPSIY